MWNSEIHQGSEIRTLNRQLSLIENNFIFAPNAVSFVNCFSFTDYLTVKGNRGQTRTLVLVNDRRPGRENIARNINITDNILRIQGLNDSTGMRILSGTHVENLTLANNIVEGYLWYGLDKVSVANLRGTVRIIGNEARKKDYSLFYTNDEIPVTFPDSVNVFFSDNISKGVKTDVGPYSIATSPKDGVLFTGRQFFCTSAPHKNKLIIFNGESWEEVH